VKVTNSEISKLQIVGDEDVSHFIENNFNNLYYTTPENRWLDTVGSNLTRIGNPYKRAIATHALSQACIIKRPYNLFHRANLYMRFADVKRSFGNMISWNTDFPLLFSRFMQEANQHVFSNNQDNKAMNVDAMDLPVDHDLVYIDSPYMTPKNGGIDYLGYYHFLEGLSRYDEWENLIDITDPQKRIKSQYSVWLDKKRIGSAFDSLFEKFSGSKIVVSYRSGGIPDAVSIKRMLKKYKREVVLHRKYYQYALAHTSGWELLFVAT
jgi:hypothetical protein